MNSREIIKHICDEMIIDMNSVNRSNTKNDIMAHIDYWQNLIQTIKEVNEK